MKYFRIIFFLALFHTNLYSQQINWPFRNTVPVLQNKTGKISGTPGEYRDYFLNSINVGRYHGGVDITNNTDRNLYPCDNGGLLSSSNSTSSSNPWPAYIHVGAIVYKHAFKSPTILNGMTINNNTQFGEYFQSITGFDAHVHLDSEVGTFSSNNTINYLYQRLHPFSDSQIPFFHDMSTTPPTLLTGNGNNINVLQFYRNGIDFDTHPNSTLLNQTVTINNTVHKILYGKVDIRTKVIDYHVSPNGTGTGGANAPHSIVWSVYNNAGQPVANLNGINWFHMNDIPTDNSARYVFGDDSDNNTFYILTAHPRQTPYDRYLNTRIRNNVTETWPANSAAIDTYDPKLLRLKDGRYNVRVRAADAPDFINNTLGASNNSIQYEVPL